MFTGDSGHWKKQGVRHGDNLKAEFSYTLAESDFAKEVRLPASGYLNGKPTLSPSGR